MNPNTILIDRKTYHNVNEMPADIRQKYEQALRGLGDTNTNNIPDAFESLNIFADKDRNGAPDLLVNSVKIVVERKDFNGLENLPPEVRAKYEEAMRGLDANRNGIPDFVEGMAGASAQPVNPSASLGTQTPRRAPLAASSPTITPDTSNGWMLVLTGLFIFTVCVAGVAVVWYFFLR